MNLELPLLARTRKFGMEDEELERNLGAFSCSLWVRSSERGEKRELSVD
jgi:hypothetical protein